MSTDTEQEPLFAILDTDALAERLRDMTEVLTEIRDEISGLRSDIVTYVLNGES